MWAQHVNDTSNMLLQEIRSALERISRRRTYAAGEAIFLAGELPRGVCLIEKGTISIVLSRSERHDVQAPEKRSGILFGLSESVSGQANKFTVQAIDDCEASFVAREAFVEFLQENQVFCLKIVRFLSENLHQLYYALQQESGTNVRNRRATR